MSGSEVIILFLRILLTGVLYVFLGGALWLIWQNLRLTSRQTSQVRPPELSLAQQLQPEAVRRFQVSEVLLGRDPGCDFPLDDVTVSQRHARLSFHHGQWWVEDLGSKNGTFVNGQPVSQAQVVVSGDELQLGQVRLLVQLDSPN